MKRSRLTPVILMLCVALIAVTAIIAVESARKASSTESEKSGANEGTERTMELREIALEEGIEASLPNPAMSVRRYAGKVSFDLPGKTFEVSSDNEYLMRGDDPNYYKSGTKKITLADGAEALVCGTPVELGYSLNHTNTTLRLIIREDDMIVGYALVCFWEPIGGKSMPSYNYAEVVKAVLFENPDKANVTMKEVNALLDKAYQELVIDAALFETRSENSFVR